MLSVNSGLLASLCSVLFTLLCRATVVTTTTTTSVTSDLTTNSSPPPPPPPSSSPPPFACNNKTDLLAVYRNHRNQPHNESEHAHALTSLELSWWQCRIRLVRLSWSTDSGSTELLVAATVFNQPNPNANPTHRSDVNLTNTDADFWPLTPDALLSTEHTPTVLHFRLVVRLDQSQKGCRQKTGPDLIVEFNQRNYSFPLDHTRTTPVEFPVSDEQQYEVKQPHPQHSHSTNTDTGQTTLQLANQPPQLPTLRAVSVHQSCIADSYVVFCVDSANPHQSNCTTTIDPHTRQLQCYCSANYSGILVVSVELTLAWLLLLATLLYLTACFASAPAPEVQLNTMLCMVGRSTHEYVAVFRVGPATEGFRHESATVDLQLLTTGPPATAEESESESVSVGIPVRFSANRFPDRLCAELHMLCLRMTPMPPITAVRAVHSCAGQLLFLHDLTIVDVRAPDHPVVQADTIRQFIPGGGEAAVLRTDAAKPEAVQRRLFGNADERVRRQRRLWQTLITVEPLTPTEAVVTALVIVALVALGTSAAAECPRTYLRWKDGGCLVMAAALIRVVIIAVATAALVVLAELLFVAVIKPQAQVETYLAMTTISPVEAGKGDDPGNGGNAPFPVFWLLRLLYLGLSVAAGIGLSIVALQRAATLDATGGWLWSGVQVTSWVVAGGGWAVGGEAVFGWLRRRGRGQNSAATTTADLVRAMTDSGLVSGSAEGVAGSTAANQKRAGITVPPIREGLSAHDDRLQSLPTSVTLGTLGTLGTLTTLLTPSAIGPKMANPDWVKLQTTTAGVDQNQSELSRRLSKVKTNTKTNVNTTNRSSALSTQVSKYQRSKVSSGNVGGGGGQRSMNGGSGDAQIIKVAHNKSDSSHKSKRRHSKGG